MKFNENSMKFEKVKVIICKPYLKGEEKKIINIRTKLHKEFIPNTESRLIEKICVDSFQGKIIKRRNVK